jgi:hypothetical protein
MISYHATNNRRLPGRVGGRKTKPNMNRPKLIPFSNCRGSAYDRFEFYVSYGFFGNNRFIRIMDLKYFGPELINENMKKK